MDEMLHAPSMLELFQDLPPQEQEELKNITTLSMARRGKILYSPDETSEVLFILQSGRVQLYRIAPDGKKLIISTLEKGTLFGEMPLLGQQLHNTFAEAITDCTYCVIQLKELERLIIQYPAVALRILAITKRRLHHAENHLKDLTFKSIPARLASLILNLAGEEETDVTGFTHQDLAEMVGTYRETITQVLNDLKNKGLIDIGRKRLVIRDREGLQALADS